VNFDPPEITLPRVPRPSFAFFAKEGGAFTSDTNKPVYRRFSETQAPEPPKSFPAALAQSENFRYPHQSKSLPHSVHTVPYIQNVLRGTFVQIAVMFHREHFSIL
jgi:hypothetical protein